MVSASVTLPGPDLPHAGPTEPFDGTEELAFTRAAGQPASECPSVQVRFKLLSAGDVASGPRAWHLAPPMAPNPSGRIVHPHSPTAHPPGDGRRGSVPLPPHTGPRRVPGGPLRVLAWPHQTRPRMAHRGPSKWEGVTALTYLANVQARVPLKVDVPRAPPPRPAQRAVRITTAWVPRAAQALFATQT